MNEQDIEKIKKLKEDRELLDIVDKIIKLQRQIECPDRNGMIDALHDAQQIACDEIVQNLHQQSGAVCSKPWIAFSDSELYKLLPMYQQGLANHGISKVGKSAFEKMWESIAKRPI